MDRSFGSIHGLSAAPLASRPLLNEDEVREPLHAGDSRAPGAASGHIPWAKHFGITQRWNFYGLVLSREAKAAPSLELSKACSGLERPGTGEGVPVRGREWDGI